MFSFVTRLGSPVPSIRGLNWSGRRLIMAGAIPADSEPNILVSRVVNQQGDTFKEGAAPNACALVRMHIRGKTRRCSGALLHVPVTGCRLCGSSANLARGHLAAKERCPPPDPLQSELQPRTSQPGNSASHLSTRKLHQICAVTLPAAFEQAALRSWKTISSLDNRIKLQRK